MEIIILIVVISLLSIILFIALKKLVEQITIDSKDYYLEKMQDYDAKIFEKEQELQNKASSNEEYKEKANVSDKSNASIEVDRELLKILNQTDYEGINALKLANKVDEIFNIDEEKILRNFVSKLDVNNDYETYQMLIDRFSPNLIYKLKMLDINSQIKVIGDMISDKEYEVFASYIERHKFNLNKFLLDLSLLIEKSVPKIEVICGNKNKNYDHISPYIKTTYSEDILKGIIIKYQDKIYDYSINERDV